MKLTLNLIRKVFPNFKTKKELKNRIEELEKQIAFLKREKCYVLQSEKYLTIPLRCRDEVSYLDFEKNGDFVIYSVKESILKEAERFIEIETSVNPERFNRVIQGTLYVARRKDI